MIFAARRSAGKRRRVWKAQDDEDFQGWAVNTLSGRRFDDTDILTGLEGCCGLVVGGRRSRSEEKLAGRRRSSQERSRASREA